MPDTPKPNSAEEPAPKGLASLVKSLFDELMPRGVSWPQTLGSTLLALVVVQIVTGILLSLYYSPNADVAYESVQYIETQVMFGKLIRGLHHFAASAMVIVLFLHMIRTFFYGSYKPPRQMTWLHGVALLMIVLGFAFTGYLLPWDMKAYYATKVGINIAGNVPFIGDYIVRIMQGGDEMGTITLSRFFSLHVIVLPLSLLLVLAGHLYYIRVHGTTPPWQRNDETVTYTNRFYPQQLFRDSVVAFLVVAILVLLAARFGAPLEARADPNDTTYVPRPDWYFYSLFQLLKIFEGKLEIIGAVILPGAFFTLMLLLPYIDRNPERRLSRRPVAVVAGAVSVLAIVALTAWGAYSGARATKSTTTEPDPLTHAGETRETFVVDANRGKLLYEELDCGECHKGPSERDNLPPGLEFAGNKYHRSWLVEYLQSPHRIRWASKDTRPIARMPNFELSLEEATNIAAFLQTRKVPQKFPEPEFDWAEADSEMVQSGKELVVEFGCVGCHVIGDQGQNIGPDLSRVGNKLLDAYMFHLVRSPGSVIPGTSMKDFGLDQIDVEDIVAYLRTLN